MIAYQRSIITGIVAKVNNRISHCTIRGCDNTTTWNWCHGLVDVLAAELSFYLAYASST